MTFKFRRGHRRRFMPPAAASLALALVALGGPAQAVLVTTYNTGTSAPVPVSTLLVPGAVDPNYQRMVSVGGSGGGTLLGSAVVAGPVLPGYWLGAGGPSGWIQTAFNYDGTVPPMFGTSYFQTTFNLTGLDPSTANFSGRWATDDPVGVIHLNGQNLISAGGSFGVSAPGAWTTFGFSGGSLASGTLNAGVNYLTFEVTRLAGPVYFGPAALRVEYGGDALPIPEPSTYALMGLGLATLGWACRRQARSAARCDLSV